MNLNFKHKHNSLLITILLLLIATFVSIIYVQFVPNNTINSSLIYILALVLIAHYTDGYLYGILSSFFCVIGINYLFTYPYFKINFTLTGYPITFIGMLAIAIITSTTTSLMKKQAAIINEREKEIMEAEKEKMRATLLRAISHDLRTPLTSIIGTATSYIENKDSLSETEKLDLVNNINDDSHWLLNMVENLLMVTRIQNDGGKLTKSHEAAEEIIAESVLRLRKRLPDSQIHVTIPNDLVLIPMDALLIEQVIINLLENSIIHSNSKSATELFMEISDDMAYFHVKDYGIGIAPERLPYIFDGQSNSCSSDSHKGIGIGLSICKTIVMAHGGTITAKNHEHGAEFIFSLPLN